MIEDSKPASQYHPAETKLFNGIIYSVLVPLNESRFSVVIGEGYEPLHEDVECKDVAPENHAELFERAHGHAQKIIQSGDPRLQPFIEKLNEKASTD
jgi:hypothetical protein